MIPARRADAVPPAGACVAGRGLRVGRCAGVGRGRGSGKTGGPSGIDVVGLQHIPSTQPPNTECQRSGPLWVAPVAAVSCAEEGVAEKRRGRLRFFVHRNNTGEMLDTIA